MRWCRPVEIADNQAGRTSYDYRKEQEVARPDWDGHPSFSVSPWGAFGNDRMLALGVDTTTGYSASRSDVAAVDQSSGRETRVTVQAAEGSGRNSG